MGAHIIQYPFWDFAIYSETTVTVIVVVQEKKALCHLLQPRMTSVI